MKQAKVKDFEERLETEYKKVAATIKKPNILLVGGTGVGKSSLINLVFGKELAEVGVGEPVTKQINRYRASDTSVVLHDTAGYEIGDKKQQEFLNGVVNYAIDKKKPIKEQIHLVWYCIDAGGHRVTDLDLEVIERIYNANLPIGVVFTKCDMVTLDEIKELEKEIRNKLPNLVSFRRISKESSVFQYRDEFTIKTGYSIYSVFNFALSICNNINFNSHVSL